MAVVIACAWVGTKRPISITALLSGGLAGWISAVSAYQRVVGFGLVDFFVGILLFGAVPIVIGARLAYEIRRRRGTNTEPRVGSWRHVFVLTLAVLFGSSAPWLFWSVRGIDRELVTRPCRRETLGEVIARNLADPDLQVDFRCNECGEGLEVIFLART